MSSALSEAQARVADAVARLEGRYPRLNKGDLVEVTIRETTQTYEVVQVHGTPQCVWLTIEARPAEAPKSEGGGPDLDVMRAAADKAIPS